MARAKYFPRDVMLKMGFPHVLIEYFLNLDERTGGSGAVALNLDDINTTITEINSSVDAIGEFSPPSVMIEIDRLRRKVNELESLIYDH